MENGDEIKDKKEQLNTNLVFGKKREKQEFASFIRGVFCRGKSYKKRDRELTFLPDVDDTVFRYSIVF